jgi:50S ribosomal protein L16 3-hydroxylase
MKHSKTNPILQPLQMLGGLSPKQFMAEYWQRKPLLVRQAFPGFKPLLSRAELFDLAMNEDAESRMVIGENGGEREWQMNHGPFKKRDFPKLSEPDWTILVQGVDGWSDEVAALMHQFRFIPDARLDDVMISYAADGGGVGPHFDSYDVFLIQAHGQRRWRIGKQKDLSLRDDVPLKILSNFKPQHDWVLEPGDMLYLPPQYAHDGIAVGECMTYSVGFKVPQEGELAREMLVRLSEDTDESVGCKLYKDPLQPAVKDSAAIPAEMLSFAHSALTQALSDPKSVSRLLGEYLTEPKANIWFEQSIHPKRIGAIELDRRTRMMYDSHHVFMNGESWRASGVEAKLLKLFANQRYLSSSETKEASSQLKTLFADWIVAGWVHLKK